MNLIIEDLLGLIYVCRVDHDYPQNSARAMLQQPATSIWSPMILDTKVFFGPVSSANSWQCITRPAEKFSGPMVWHWSFQRRLSRGLLDNQASGTRYTFDFSFYSYEETSALRPVWHWYVWKRNFALPMTERGSVGFRSNYDPWKGEIKWTIISIPENSNMDSISHTWYGYVQVGEANSQIMRFWSIWHLLRIFIGFRISWHSCSRSGVKDGSSLSYDKPFELYLIIDQ
jgi:hypothetical protein